MSGPGLPRSPFETFDPRFAAITNGDVKLERLATGCRWAEGPAYFPAGRYLVWSDIPNDRMLRWDECDGNISAFRSPAGYTNGHSVDRQGRLVSCEHLARRVTRTESDGTITVLADRYQGERLNSPNDVVVRSDGSIWFTDPSYGIDHDYEGLRQERELDGCHVYRVDPHTAQVTRVADDFARPNGLAFSPDESGSTSPTPGRPSNPTARATSASSTSSTAGRWQPAAYSRSAMPASSTASASTKPAAYGPRRATVCTAWRRTAR
jgi:sugar lactone lactonase YvrE